jgi:4'-phosphopantetheinyl transferase
MNSGICYFLYTPLVHPIHTSKNILKILSPERKARIMRFRNQEDAIRSVLAEILLRYALTTDFGLHNCDIKFECSRYGKPRLTGLQNIRFNISHSGNWVGCIVAENEVGLDIENERYDLPLDISEEFFSLQEQRYITGAGDAESLKRFLQIWTLKESYAKAVGKGVYLPLNSFEFEIVKDDKIILYDSDGRLAEGKSFLSFPLDDCHHCAVCIEAKKKTLQKVFLNENELFRQVGNIGLSLQSCSWD